MYLEDRFPAAHVRPVQDHPPVKTTRTEQCWVQDVGPIGGGDNDDVGIGIKAIHLDQDLIERLLPFVVATAQACAAVTPDSINFVHKDDAG